MKALLVAPGAIILGTIIALCAVALVIVLSWPEDPPRSDDEQIEDAWWNAIR